MPRPKPLVGSDEMGGYDSVSPIVETWNSNALPNDAASESEVKSKYNF